MMIRMEHETGKLVLLALAWLREQGDRTFSAVLTRLAPGNPGGYVGHILNDEGIRDRPLEEVISLLTRQLNGDPSKDEASIIDRVADVLQQPFARNALSGNMLNDLRHAVLVPSEFAGLEERLIAKETACVGCGKQLAQREVATISLDAGQVILRCTKCAHPKYIACDHKGCHQAVTAPPGIAKLLAKDHYCDAHLAEKKGDVPAGIQLDDLLEVGVPMDGGGVGVAPANPFARAANSIQGRPLRNPPDRPPAFWRTAPLGQVRDE